MTKTGCFNEIFHRVKDMGDIPDNYYLAIADELTDEEAKQESKN